MFATEAWTEQTMSKSEVTINQFAESAPSPSNHSVSLDDLITRGSQESPPLHSNSFFLTEQTLSESFDGPLLTVNQLEANTSTDGM